MTKAQPCSITPALKTWTAEEDERIRALAGILSDREIGEILGCRPRLVRRRRNLLGVKSGWFWSEAEMAMLHDMVPFMTARQMAELFGISIKAIARMCERLGLQLMNEREWTPREMVELRRLYPDHPSKEVAERVGRSPRAIETMAVRMGFRKSPAYLVAHSCEHMLLPPELREVIALSKQLKKALKDAHQH